MYSIEEIDIATFPLALKLKFINKVILVYAKLLCSKTGKQSVLKRKTDNPAEVNNRNTRKSTRS